MPPLHKEILVGDAGNGHTGTLQRRAVVDMNWADDLTNGGIADWKKYSEQVDESQKNLHS